jgi:mannitol-specific phosphotransferase system IIBC component
LSGATIKSAGITIGRQFGRLWRDESGSVVGGIGSVGIAIMASSYAFSGAGAYSVISLYKITFHRFFDLIEPALRPIY